ncbi:hypothetical protein Emed_002291 [Eimeria media]
MTEDGETNAASGVKAAPPLEKKSSRGVMGWLRQSSSRRLRSHDASRTPRELQDIGADHRGEGSRPEDSHSLAAMFKSMPHAESHQAEDESHARGAVRDRRYQRAFSLCDSGPADEHAHHLHEDESKRSTHSDPGDLSDASVGSTNHPQPREGEAGSLAEKLRTLEQQSGKKQKPKRTSSASGLSRIGSFFTRGFSRGHSRRLKDSPETPDDGKTAEGAQLSSSPALSVIVSAGSYASVSPASPACMHLESPKPPPFSASAWLQKFHEQEDATPASLAACHAAAEQLTRCLSELENSLRFVLNTSPQRLVKDREAATKTGGADDAQRKEEEEQHEHHLAQIRRDMDVEGERTLMQMQSQEDQLLLSEFLQMMGTIRRLVDTFKFNKKTREALRHDLQGEEEQLHAWERQYGALRESNDFLQDLYNRVCKVRSGLLHDYHEECVRLNQSIQLLRDKIANTISDVFSEFENPPALETLYGITFPSDAVQPPATTKSDVSMVNGVDPRSYQQLVSGHLPPFIMRLKLYAYNRVGGNEQLSTSPDKRVPAQLFSPLRLDECLPRHSCIKSVPPGLAIMSSEAEIARYEARLWGGGDGEAGEGSWGSFRVFEQWLVDSMKWQWRDAFMYANLRERRGSVQQMIAAKKADLEEAVRLRLKQLWWGRLVEMQNYHTDRAGRFFKKELAQSGGACIPEKVGETDESEQSEEPVFRGVQMNSVDVEKALMSAEDARSCVLRVTDNVAFTAFTKALENMEAEPRAEFFKEQVQRASDLVRQYDDINEDPGSYEVLERECMQIEAALALLKEEISTLEKKRSARQAQLATKRKNLTQALETLAAAFDADNKQLAAIEAQWDSAGKVEELVQKWLPTADSISAVKEQLAEQQAALDAQQAQIEEERRQLNAQKQQQQSILADHPKPSSSRSSPLSSPRHSSRRGSDLSGHNLPSASISHSKSFMSRLFGSSSNHPKLAEDELTSDVEGSRRRTIVRRESVLSEPPLSELPLPLPSVKEEQQQQQQQQKVKSSDEADRHQLHAQKNASTETIPEANDSSVQRPRPPPLSAQASSPSPSSVLYVQLEPESSPTEAAVTPSFHEADEAVTKQQQQQQQTVGGDEEVDEQREGEARKRAKAKSSTTTSSSRKSQRKKKSMYSKLRSALSLSKTFHEGSENKEESSVLPAEEKAAVHASPGEAEGVVAAFSLSQGLKAEGGWVGVGRQSSVLAAIPNIFEEAEQEASNDHPKQHACSSPDTRNAERVIARAEESPKEEDVKSAEVESLRNYAKEETSSNRGAPVAVGLTDGEVIEEAPSSSAVSHHQTLADAFRRSYAPRRERGDLLASDEGRFSPRPSSSERSITPDPLEKEEHQLETALNSRQRHAMNKDQLNADLLTSSREEDSPTEIDGSPVNQAATAAASIIAFPSLSAGEPAEFRWDTRHQGPSSPFAPFQEEGLSSNRGEMRRRRSDSESLPVHMQNALRERKTNEQHRARGRTPAFNRENGPLPPFLGSAASRYVVEDDRIDLFLSNGQADLNAAVIGSCIFSLLDAEERQHCIFLMQNSFVQVPKGCMLVQRGDKVDTLYFVVSGSLGMTEPHACNYLEDDPSRRLNVPVNSGRRRSSYDGEVSLEEYPIELSQGAFITPRAFVREQQTDHSVVALRPCTLQKLSFHSFQQVLSGESIHEYLGL